MNKFIKIKKGQRVFLLSKHNGEYQGWNEIPGEDFDKWINDGSASEGDLIVISGNVIELYERVELKLKDANAKKGVWK